LKFFVFADDQNKSSLQTENISDTTLKEIQEKVTETTRSSQPPRTPSRASRSSSIMTPTKVSTRNASRAMTPNSSKQTTPNKLQYTEKTHEILDSSESISEESVVQQEKISKLSSEKYEEEQEDNVLNIIQNESHSLPSEKSQEEEIKHINILETKCKANVSQVPATEPSEKSSIITHIDEFSISQAEHEAKEINIDESSKIQITEEIKDIAKLEEKVESKEDIDTDKVQDDTFEENIEQNISVEKESVKHIEDTYNIKDNSDIPIIKQSTHVIPDQIDEMCDIELKDKEKATNEDYIVQDEKMDVSDNIEDANEKANDDILQDEQVYMIYISHIKTKFFFLNFIKHLSFLIGFFTFVYKGCRNS